MTFSLVFSGGGPKALHAVAAVRAIEDVNGGAKQFYPQVVSVAGVSIGAFLCLAAAFARPADVVATIMTKAELFRACTPQVQLQAFGMLGLETQQRMSAALENALVNLHINPHMSVADAEQITQKKIYITCASVLTGQRVQLNSPQHHAISLLDALLCSMCVPVLFPPRKLGKNLVIDGGTVDNFPLDLHAPASLTYGVCLEERETDLACASLKDYAGRLCCLASIQRQHERKEAEKKSGQDTVIIYAYKCDTQPGFAYWRAKELLDNQAYKDTFQGLLRCIVLFCKRMQHCLLENT